MYASLHCFKYIIFFVCIKVYQFKNRSLKRNKFENLDLLSSVLKNSVYPSFARQSFKFVLNVTDTRNMIMKVAFTSVWLLFVLFCHNFVFIASSEISYLCGKTLPYSWCYNVYVYSSALSMHGCVWITRLEHQEDFISLSVRCLLVFSCKEKLANTCSIRKKINPYQNKPKQSIRLTLSQDGKF